MTTSQAAHLGSTVDYGEMAMTAVMEPTGPDTSQSEDLVYAGLTSARQAYIDLVQRYRPRVLEAARGHRLGFPVGSLGTLANPSDLSALDSGRVADAIAEAMIGLLSEGEIALTVDQKLVPVEDRS